MQTLDRAVACSKRPRSRVRARSPISSARPASPRPTAHRLAVALERPRPARPRRRRPLPPRRPARRLGRAAAGAAALVEPRPVRCSRASCDDDRGERAALRARGRPPRSASPRHERPSGLRDTVPLGAVMPLTKGSGGKVLLAWAADRDRVRRRRRASLAAVRPAGWAESVGEREAGVASVSAPVRVPDGAVVAAISVSGPAERLGAAATRRRHGAAGAAAAAAVAGPRPSRRSNKGETNRLVPSAAMNVEVVRWPADEQRVGRAAASAVSPGCSSSPTATEPPIAPDCLEDWVSASAPGRASVDARRARVAPPRPRHTAWRPLLDDDGLLHHRDHWVSLSPVEQSLAARAARPVRRGRRARHARRAGLARGAADAQRARRARAAAAPPHRAARARDPHRAVAGLPAPERPRNGERPLATEARTGEQAPSRAARDRHRRDVHRCRRRRRAGRQGARRRRTTRRAPSADAIARACRRGRPGRARPRHDGRDQRAARAARRARRARSRRAGSPTSSRSRARHRPSLYDPFADRPAPLVPRALRFEVAGGSTRRGREIEAVGRRRARAARRTSKRSRSACCTPTSNPQPERAVAAALRAARVRRHRARASSRPSSASTSAWSRPSSNAYLRPACAPVPRAARARSRDEVLVMTSAGGLVAGRPMRSTRPRRCCSRGRRAACGPRPRSAAACGYPDAVSVRHGRHEHRRVPGARRRARARAERARRRASRSASPRSTSTRSAPAADRSPASTPAARSSSGPTARGSDARPGRATDAAVPRRP